MIISHWRLGDNKTPKVSRTFHSILDNLNDAVVSMVSTRPLISKSSSPCTDPLVTVPSALMTIGITDTYIFPSFFQFSSKVNFSLLVAGILTGGSFLNSLGFF